MSFVDVMTVGEREATTKNLRPYREAFDKLGYDNQGTLPVPTGDLLTEGQNKGKGKEAMKHDRAFRDVARERNVGIHIVHTNLPEVRDEEGNVTKPATTLLTLRTNTKRESTPEQIKNRTEKAAQARAKKAVEKLMAEGMSQADAVKQVQAEIKARNAAKAAAAKKNGA